MLLHWKNQYCQNGLPSTAIYGFNAMSIRLLMTFFTDLGQNILKFVWKHEDHKEQK